MNAKELKIKGNRAYVSPTCIIFMMNEEPLLAGSEDSPTPVDPPSGETEYPNPAKQYSNTSVWDED